MSQLALPLSLQDPGVFESFWAGDNEPLVAFLRHLADSVPDNGSPPGCWIWGSEATGKTHLLQAVSERLGDDSVFVPLDQFTAAGAGILDDLANRRCVCLDNIDAVASHDHFEFGLFTLLNQIADRQVILVASARAAPRDCGFALPDLQSRLSRLPVFYLEPLDEAGRMQALKLRANHRGLELPDDTARFLLSRSRRDMASLYNLLDHLDAEALKAQRRLTIPFVRNVLLDAKG
ncbi:MAG: DnaA regulatory inactivator Hda [Woeseia sp.]